MGTHAQMLLEGSGLASLPAVHGGFSAPGQHTMLLAQQQPPRPHGAGCTPAPAVLLDAVWSRVGLGGRSCWEHGVRQRTPPGEASWHQAWSDRRDSRPLSMNIACSSSTLSSLLQTTKHRTGTLTFLYFILILSHPFLSLLLL